MLKIIDLKVGNIGSVIKAFKFLKAEYEVITEPEQLKGATRILLPGVGSFDIASERLMNSGFVEPLKKIISDGSIPLLGICVGMQLLATVGFEGKESLGLGVFNSKVLKLDDMNGSLVIPHMGWNDISTEDMELFVDIPVGSCFYFVHSYAMVFDSTDEVTIAYTSYGNDVVAYVKKGNVHGAQFHPEKSQAPGLQFLRNFINLC